MATNPRTRRFVLVPGAIVFAMGLQWGNAGCGKKNRDKSDHSHEADDPQADDASTNTTPDDAPTADAPSPRLITGIAECDQPYAQYVGCIMVKMPPESRAVTVDGLARMAESWNELSRRASTRDDLTTACKSATIAWKQSAAQLGCEWSAEVDSAFGDSTPDGSTAERDATNEAADESGDGRLATGIPECDTPYNKYMTCVLAKVPESERAATLAGMKRSAKVWNATAATEAGRTDLAETCKSAATAWAQAAAGLGCDW